jgi:hypothetical protein
MWIVLEGVDGAGKTTLAKELLSRIERCSLTHLGPPESPMTALDECLHGPDNAFADYHPASNYSIVTDRLHWGCPAYGPIYRPVHDHDGYGDIGRGGWRYVELFLAARGAVTGVIDADPAVIRIRLAERGDDYVDVKDIDQIIDCYRKLCADALTLKMITRLRTPEHTNDAADLLITHAMRAAVATTHLARFPSYIGPPSPSVLAVTPPYRSIRLEVLANLPAGRWQNVGFTTRLPVHDHRNLVKALNNPKIVSFRGPSGLPVEDAADHTDKIPRLTQILKELSRDCVPHP